MTRDDRLTSAFARNRDPIIAALLAKLARVTGDALEVGSGPGEHAVAFAQSFPALTWWPSDPDPVLRGSIAGWVADTGLSNLMAPCDIDATWQAWPLGGPGQPPVQLAAIVAVNISHIAPWTVTLGLLDGAARHLAANGVLAVYGPFARNGDMADSNRRFDASLRMSDPDWGVRDLADIAAAADERGLALVETVDMPANNMMLFIERGA